MNTFLSLNPEIADGDSVVKGLSFLQRMSQNRRNKRIETLKSDGVFDAIAATVSAAAKTGAEAASNANGAKVADAIGEVASSLSDINDAFRGFTSSNASYMDKWMLKSHVRHLQMLEAIRDLGDRFEKGMGSGASSSGGGAGLGKGGLIAGILGSVGAGALALWGAGKSIIDKIRNKVPAKGKLPFDDGKTPKVGEAKPAEAAAKSGKQSIFSRMRNVFENGKAMASDAADSVMQRGSAVRDALVEAGRKAPSVPKPALPKPSSLGKNFLKAGKGLLARGSTVAGAGFGMLGRGLLSGPAATAMMILDPSDLGDGTPDGVRTGLFSETMTKLMSGKITAEAAAASWKALMTDKTHVASQNFDGRIRYDFGGARPQSNWIEANQVGSASFWEKMQKDYNYYVHGSNGTANNIPTASGLTFRSDGSIGPSLESQMTPKGPSDRPVIAIPGMAKPSDSLSGGSGSTNISGSAGSDTLSDSGMTSTDATTISNIRKATGFKLESAMLEARYWRKKVREEEIDAGLMGGYGSFGNSWMGNIANSVAGVAQRAGTGLYNAAVGMSQPLGAIVPGASGAGSSLGLSSNFYDTLSWVESRNNPNAVSSTGATGLFQFTDETGRGYGLVGNGFDNRRDPKASFEAVQKLTANNIAELQRRGIPVNDLNTYLSHQLGSKGFNELYMAMQGSSSLSNDRAKAMSLNMPSSFKSRYGSVNQALATMGSQATATAYYNSWAQYWAEKAAEASTVGTKSAPSSTLPVPANTNPTPGSNSALMGVVGAIPGVGAVASMAGRALGLSSTVPSAYKETGEGAGGSGPTSTPTSAPVANAGQSTIAGFNKSHANVDTTRLTPNTVSAMTNMQRMFGGPLTLNSAYRSPEYNAKVGGAPNSTHMKGQAIDVSTEGMNAETKAHLLKSALASGFTSVGFYDKFMHFDTRHGGTTWGSQPSWAAPIMGSMWKPGMTSAMSGGIGSTMPGGMDPMAAADAGMSSTVAGVAGGGMAGIAEGMRIGNAMVHGNISTPSLPRINESPASVRAATTPVSQGGNTFVGGGGSGGGRSSGGGRKADVDSILSQVEDYGLIHVLTEGNN